MAWKGVVNTDVCSINRGGLARGIASLITAAGDGVVETESGADSSCEGSSGNGPKTLLTLHPESFEERISFLIMSMSKKSGLEQLRIFLARIT